MTNKEIFSISSFAKFSRTTRDTLIHYDKIGLLRPVCRGENNYRFYSSQQLAAVNLIRTCQSLGMRLSEIERLIKQRSPEQIEELLGKQIGKIDERIDEWVRSRKLLSHLKRTINLARNADTEAVTVEELPAEAIVLGGVNNYSGDRNDYDALLSFYHTESAKHPEMDLNYPVWGWFSQESIQNGKWFWPDRYYFSSPSGNDRRLAGLYAIGYGKGGYGKNDELFKRVLDHISLNGCEISGPAYVEYPLNEIAVSDPSEYLIRVIITVRKV